LERTANVQYILVHLQEVPVELVAVLGEVDTTLQELNELKPGDLIPLDAAAHRDIKVLVGGIHRFWARPGTRGTRLAVEITRVVTDEVEEL
jgi:flagellar motor switch protein FliM